MGSHARVFKRGVLVHLGILTKRKQRSPRRGATIWGDRIVVGGRTGKLGGEGENEFLGMLGMLIFGKGSLERGATRARLHVEIKNVGKLWAVRGVREGEKGSTKNCGRRRR